MVMLGSYLELNPILKFDSIIKGLEKVLPERRHNLISVNEQALRMGSEIIRNHSKLSEYSDITVDSLI